LKNCTSLQDLGLIGNKLTSIPKALHGLQVRTLDIGENQITHVDSASFTGMSQLIGLRIVDNLLEEITSLCETIPRLRVFNGAQNKITKVSPSAFVACPELKVLRLDSNRLSEIPTLETPNLLWLNVSQNGK
jgi:Leucine-rich repeat (LRR) protein